jgi:hypothetical protein
MKFVKEIPPTDKKILDFFRRHYKEKIIENGI